jgi:hypothetical protein
MPGSIPSGGSTGGWSMFSFSREYCLRHLLEQNFASERPSNGSPHTMQFICDIHPPKCDISVTLSVTNNKCDSTSVDLWGDLGLLYWG